MSYERLLEIATTAMSYLADNDMLDDFLEDRYIDLDDSEMEFFFPEED